MCHHTRRCALTLSPCGPHHFTHHHSCKSQIFNLKSYSKAHKMGLKKPVAGLFSVALVVARESQISNFNLEISDLRASGAPPLAGSLPCSVRTFLSWTELKSINSRCNPRNKGFELLNSSSDRPTCSLARPDNYTKPCSTRTANAQARFNVQPAPL